MRIRIESAGAKVAAREPLKGSFIDAALGLPLAREARAKFASASFRPSCSHAGRKRRHCRFKSTGPRTKDTGALRCNTAAKASASLDETQRECVFHEMKHSGFARVACFIY